MSPKSDTIAVRIELIPDAVSETKGTTQTFYWGWSYSMDGAGGSGNGGVDQLSALKAVMRHVRREVKRAMETKAEKADRLARRKEALKRAKDKGLI